jgi:hypothetical protein
LAVNFKVLKINHEKIDTKLGFESHANIAIFALSFPVLKIFSPKFFQSQNQIAHHHHWMAAEISHPKIAIVIRHHHHFS